MRVLLSTIGSRGDVQPLVALATELRRLGQEVCLCVPPDFREWIQRLGMEVTPIGPKLRAMGKASAPAGMPTPEQRRRMMEDTVATQFETIAAAAQGCDVIVGATALQFAAPSVAEHMGVPYVFAAYSPVVLPSPRHAPPVLIVRGEAPAPAEDYGELWDQDARRWNDGWRAMVNARRASLGLAAIDDVRGHVLTNRPWLAADATLAPWPEASDGGGDSAVFQTGAWLLPDERPLPPEVEAFLDAGDPPVYFGFGSMRVPADLGRVVIQAARALGRRAIVSRGWAELALGDGEPDCIAVDEVNQQALFTRVAAVVHHGGAGTTTVAARAGAPQVIVPQFYDQHYWAQRIDALGIGVAHAVGTPTAASLASAMERALQPGVAARARSLAPSVRDDGAGIAARQIIAGPH
jgi:vancomycin aglycone glucosyltransferase